MSSSLEYMENDHWHATKWRITVNLAEILNDNNVVRTGTHEMGHVLGLCDMDNHSSWHHEEVIMGYDSPRQEEITYQDLAGVIINREFHTDNDHKWLYDSSSSTNSNYKLICSICNGVKYVEDLSNYTYNTYKYCGDNHTLSSNNMMPVGCYQNKDYIKCQYCRYVSPFTNNVTQDYQYVNYGDAILHRVINQVNGLIYNFNEKHSSDGDYSWQNMTTHTSLCLCGKLLQEAHVVSSDAYNSGTSTAPCLLCGGNATIGFIEIQNSIVKISDNGSFILSNGVIVLVDSDYEDYLNGTLIFRNINDDVM